MATKINVGGKDYTFTDLQDLKQQFEAELTNINTKLSANDTKTKVEQLKNEEKEEIKKIKDKYDKKIKNLQKDVKSLEIAKKNIEDYKKALIFVIIIKIKFFKKENI